MKKKKGNIGVRELFNKQLGNVEAIPDSGFEQRLMKELARKEFMQFIPTRFNIYYLGGIIATGVITGLLIFTSVKEKVLPTSWIAPYVSSYTGEISPVTSLTEQPESITGLEQRENTVLPDKVTTAVETTESKSVIAVTETNISETGIIADNPQKDEPVTILKSSVNYGNKASALPLSAIRMSAEAGCLPLKIKFSNGSLNFDSCVWTFGDGGSSSETNPEWIFDEAGVYRITLTVFNETGLKSIAIDSVTVYRKPEALFEVFSDDITIPADEVRFMNFSSNAIEFKWEFGDGGTSEEFEPVYRYRESGLYNVRLIVRSEYGCTDSLVVENAFEGQEYYITFPNAFIPNSGGPSGGIYSSKSDETAQVFHPYSSEVAEYQLRIFSKLGILIFESNDINIGWDGYYKGVLSEPGVYIWKVRGKYNNGEPFVKMGDVILLKN